MDRPEGIAQTWKALAAAQQRGKSLPGSSAVIAQDALSLVEQVESDLNPIEIGGLRFGVGDQMASPWIRSRVTIQAVWAGRRGIRSRL